MQRSVSDLVGKNIVVFDCEIENVIDSVKIGWKDFHKMGLSVGVIYDYQTGDYSVYLKNDVQDLCDRLNRADLVVAFNQEGFDLPLLAGSGGILGEVNNYDMLKYSRFSLGWTPKDRFPSGLTLDNHLEAIFGKENMKTMHGSEAPIEWQKGNAGKVITYCIADVRREKSLLEHIYVTGKISSLAHGQRDIDISKIIEACGG